MKKYVLVSLFTTLGFIMFTYLVGFKTKQYPNIILFIGDGMGVSQLSTVFLEKQHPNIERFSVVGLSRTASSAEKITDSAAGATALACGKKTYNGAIAVNEQGDSLATILELLKQKGYKTGVISTSSITHATPACFYAHVPSRKMEEEIAEALLNSQVDYFAGGGLQFFTDRKDKRNLLQNANIEFFTKEYWDATLNPQKRYGFLLAKNGMPKMQEGRGNFLQKAALQAIRFFTTTDAPYFLMIEGSQIDWGGHANDGAYIVEEMKDFDRSIGAVLDFLKNDNNTLIVVTADHETGGFTLAAQQEKVPFGGVQDNYKEIKYSFSTGGHSAAMVPVLAHGKGAQKFNGIYQNTEIFERIMQVVRDE